MTALGLSLMLAVLAAIGTGLTLVYARRRRLLDLPGERRSHSVPTPRGGGLGITVAGLAGTAAAVAGAVLPPATALCFAAGLVLVAGTGWIDDHRPLSPWSRLVVQGVAGLLLGAAMLFLQWHWAWALLGCAAVPVLVNVWNFMDGIDGIATSQAVIALACFALLAPAPVDGVAWAAAAACLGFLPYNFPRARIFLGDVGSGTLGYLLAATGTWAAAALAAEGAGGRVLLLVLPLSAFMVDASATLLRRVAHGERWWLPHVSHLYQRWAASGAGHVSVTRAYALFSLLAGCLAYVANAPGTVSAVIVVAAWLLLAGVIWGLLGRRLHLP